MANDYQYGCQYQCREENDNTNESNVGTIIVSINVGVSMIFILCNEMCGINRSYQWYEYNIK